VTLSKVSTEYCRHGIPYIFFTSVFFYTELPQTPRNYAEFRVTTFDKIPLNYIFFCVRKSCMSPTLGVRHTF
jgi:hypothetical protein